MGWPDTPSKDRACPKCGTGVLYVTSYWDEGYQAQCLAPHCGFSESRLHAPPDDAQPGYSVPGHDDNETHSREGAV